MPTSLAMIGRRSQHAPAGGAAGSFADAGLFALTELMQSPEVHDAVVTFRTVLQAAREQVGVLAAYKHLHDLFQQLEDRYYLIYHDGRRLPGDLSAWASMERNEPELQAVIDDLLDLSGHAPVAADMLLWQRKLAQAQDELRAAIEQQEPEQLRRAIAHMKDVLSREPSRINTRLVAAAGTLRLSALVRALATVRDCLAHLRLDQETAHRVEAFAHGVDALAGLDSRLAEAIATHNTFQELDDELRRIEALLDQDLREIERAWQSLKPVMQRLCGGSEAAWALKFSAIGAELEHTLASQNPSKILRLFRGYRSQAIRGFSQVDRDLLTLCEELQQVGEPLAIVLRMVA